MGGMAGILKETTVKNVILIILLVLLIAPVQDYLAASGLAADKASSGAILMTVSILAVIACFGCFAFTYEKINVKSPLQRCLAHFTTGLFMLVIGISLILTGMLTSVIMGRFILIDAMLVLLYLACAGYDFWDVLRIGG